MIATSINRYLKWAPKNSGHNSIRSAELYGLEDWDLAKGFPFLCDEELHVLGGETILAAMIFSGAGYRCCEFDIS